MPPSAYLLSFPSGKHRVSGLSSPPGGFRVAVTKEPRPSTLLGRRLTFKPSDAPGRRRGPRIDSGRLGRGPGGREPGAAPRWTAGRHLQRRRRFGAPTTAGVHAGRFGGASPPDHLVSFALLPRPEGRPRGRRTEQRSRRPPPPPSLPRPPLTLSGGRRGRSSLLEGRPREWQFSSFPRPSRPSRSVARSSEVRGVPGGVYLSPWRLEVGVPGCRVG